MSEETSQPSTEESQAQTQKSVVTDHGENTGTEITYANGKYKSVSDLEAGYAELQKSYSQKLGGFDGAPEEYALAEGIESNDRIDALMEWGKQNQLSNDGLNSLIEMDGKIQEEINDRFYNEQKELLGKNADERLKNLEDWGRATFGENKMETFKQMAVTADQVGILETMMKKMQGVTPATAKAQTTVDQDTLRKMRFALDDYGNRRMSSDPAYRARVESLEAEMLANR